MALSDDELLEKQLTEAGNQLLSPPSSVAELLSSLDRVENLLTRVEQSPSESMKAALSPSMKALIANELLRHKDIDVNVAVASCISEITRITAPDAPYEDDQMKEVFQLIVSSFEKLDDQSSPSYGKRTSILETVAKVRSCVVMLDLECDTLIAEMFHHFFRTIRSEHPENVFSSMETIMTLVLEESEDISTDLCSSILDVLKTENKEVLPVARQLGEKVADKCASKLKPYLLPTMKSRGTTLDDYSKVVAKVFRARTEAVELSEAEAAKKNVADEDDLANTPSEKAVEVALETLDDAPPSEEVGPGTVGSPKAMVSNGMIQKEVEDTSAGNEDSKEVNNEADDDSKEVNNEAHDEVGEQSKGKVDNSDAEELTKSRNKPVKVNKRKGKKMNSLKSSSEPTVMDEKEIAETPVPQEKNGKDADNAQTPAVEADSTEPAKNEKEPEAPVPSPKTSNEPVDAPSSPTGSVADDNPKKDESGKKKDELGKRKDETVESEPAGGVEMKEECDVKKSSEGVSASESKLPKQTGKKAPLATDKEGCVLSVDDPKEDEKTSDVDAKSAKQLGKKAEGVVSPRDNKKKRGQGKATPAKELTKTLSKDEKKPVGSAKSTAKSTKDESDVEKASESNSKRKRTSEKKVTNEKKVSSEKKVPFEKKAAKYGKELVGLKVQVWWPDDKKYYKGVIEHFEPASGKHKVLYSDGDVEVLKLEKEKWKLINNDSMADQGDSSDGERSRDEAAETPKAKKAKTSPALAAKQGKTETSAKKSGSSTSNSKTTTKPRTKLKDDSKVDGKEKDETLKSIAKSEEDKGGKNKDSKSGNKDKTPKAVGKYKANDVDASKGSNKLKQETPKGATKSKGKSPKSGSKSNNNSSSRVKDSPPAEDEDTEDMESSPEPPKVPEISKGKSVNTSKSKSAKKRKRGAKG